MSNNEIEELKKKIKKLEKINAALMKKADRETPLKHDAFAKFEGRVLLEKEVRQRTQWLEDNSKELIKGQTKLKQLIRALPGEVYVFNRKFEIEALTDRKPPRDHLMKKNLAEVLDEEFAAKVSEIIESSTEDFFSVTFEYTIQLNEDDFATYYCGLSAVDKNRFVLYLKNETESQKQKMRLQQQELQIAKASKLTALGEMAGGIAHEINTPIGAISLYAEIIENSLSNEEDLDRERLITSAKKIVTIVERISEITGSLRQISRDGDSDTTSPYPISTLITDAVNLCQQKYRANDVDLSVDAFENWTVLANRVQISQVLVNLLNNAFYAAKIQKCGWIRIECDNLGDTIRVRIVDCGTGIEPHILSKMFNPFFTTKGVGEGTGLGLSLSQNIIRKHGSELCYKLTKDGHTSFYFELKKTQDPGVRF